ncbi:hypothetical protein BDP55DRAFT_679436 [Colletotrichum godetiae]|uniref:Uncharacterized protein n=1 Tax=Colletotrichum godetiae TaxID=1209918 RepID=A0AAJ0ESJ9_9PEZI|nr:uncharacterized protein BDP55DRAFT_679436 [Colletotrichum godetiae]KAK1659583.1 hypothetical protein BDP55DRAFT_679436 [Colletotrichum godetiae]
MQLCEYLYVSMNIRPPHSEVHGYECSPIPTAGTGSPPRCSAPLFTFSQSHALGPQDDHPPRQPMAPSFFETATDNASR